MPVWLRGMRGPRRKDFLLSQSISHPAHLPEKPPNCIRWVHRRTRTNFALSSPPLCSLSLSLDVPDSNGSISEGWQAEALIYLLRDSELSDQGAVCLQAHQILRRPETKSKHTEVPIQIHLRNGRAVCLCVCVCVRGLTFFCCNPPPRVPSSQPSRSWMHGSVWHPSVIYIPAHGYFFLRHLNSPFIVKVLPVIGLQQSATQKLHLFNT